MSTKLQLPLLAFLAVAAGCKGVTIIGGNQVQGTGPVTSDTRKVDDFTKISLGSAMQADVKFGDKTSVVVEAQKSILPLIETKVEGGELVISTKGSMSTSEPMLVHIVMKKLESVNASGASKVEVAPLSAASFEAKVDGASKIHLSGKSDSVKFDAEGASTISAEDLAVKDAVATAGGASSVNLGKASTLDVEANGASTITYEGDPTLKRSEKNGASTITTRS